jgi:hypothetical protein
MIDEIAIDAQLAAQEKQESLLAAPSKVHAVEPGRLRTILQTALDSFIAELERFEPRLPLEIRILNRNRTELQRFVIRHEWRAELGPMPGEHLLIVFPIKFLATARDGKVLRAIFTGSMKLTDIERLN